MSKASVAAEGPPTDRAAGSTNLQRPWALAVGGLLSMAAANGIDRFIYTPILPVMVDALGLTVSQAGLIASANYLGYLLGALFAARPGLAGSRRGWLLAALAVSASCTGAMALTTALPLMLVARLVSGCAGAIAIVMSIALVMGRLGVAGRSDLASVHFAGVGVGIAGSALIVAGLHAAHQGWQTMWLGAATTSITCLLLVAALVDRQRTATAAVTAPGASTALGPRLRLLLISNTLSAFGYVMTATFIVAQVRGSQELRPLESAIWVVFGLAAAPSVALWLRVARRLDVFRTFAVACLVEAIGVLASVLWLETAGTLLAAICVGGSFMGLTALSMLGARRLSVGDAQRPFALMTAGFGVGQMVGPTFAGLLRDASGSFLLPSLCAGAGLVVAAALAARAGHGLD